MAVCEEHLVVKCLFSYESILLSKKFNTVVGSETGER